MLPGFKKKKKKKPVRMKIYSPTDLSETAHSRMASVGPGEILETNP